MKKKLLTLLFGIIGFTTTFASFPVTENLSAIEVLENENTTIESSAEDTPDFLFLTPYGNWSLYLGLSYLALFIIGVSIFTNENLILIGFSLISTSILSFIAAIVTGVISLSRNETPKWKANLGLILTLGSLLLILITGM
jgi:hypothetical protein